MDDHGRPQDMMDNETSSKLLEFTLQFIQAGNAVLSQFKIEGDCKTTTIILQFQNKLETPLPAASLDSLQSASDQQSSHSKEMYSNEVPAESLHGRTNYCDNNSMNTASTATPTNMCFEVNGTNKDMVIEQLSQLMHKYSSQASEASGQPQQQQQQQTNNQNSQVVDNTRDIKENNKNKANKLKGNEDNRNNEAAHVVRNANELVAPYGGNSSDALDIEKVMNEILIERSFQQMCQEPSYNVDPNNSPNQTECKYLEASQCRPRGAAKTSILSTASSSSSSSCRHATGGTGGVDTCNGARHTDCKCLDNPMYNTTIDRTPSPRVQETEFKYQYPPPQAQAAPVDGHKGVLSVPPSPTPSPSAFCYSIPEEPEPESSGKKRDIKAIREAAQSSSMQTQYSSKFPLPLSPTIKSSSRHTRSGSQKSRISRRLREAEMNCDSDTGSMRSDTASVRTDEDYDTMDTRSSHSSRSSASSGTLSSATRQKLGATGRRKAFSATRSRSHHAGMSMMTSFSTSFGTMSNPGDRALDYDEDEDKDSDQGGDDFELLSDLSKHQKQEKKQFRRQKSIFGI